MKKKTKDLRIEDRIPNERKSQILKKWIIFGKGRLLQSILYKAAKRMQHWRKNSQCKFAFANKNLIMCF